MAIDALRSFFRLEAAGGITLVIAAIAALIVANSTLAGSYQGFLALPFSISLGDAGLSKPLLLWINDGLMAVFFLLVGLEIKREVLAGELSDRRQIVLPLIAAIGGFVVPALLYAAMNWHDPVALGGWAIPSATDIAFALGVLSLFGSRVPVSLKVFLTSIAIFDDVAAILTIAVFYSGDLSMTAFTLAGLTLAGLFVANRVGVTRPGVYCVLGLICWLCVLKSGVHATLAGIAVALLIPFRASRESNGFGEALEHRLHPWVAFGILPLFAFANAGVSFAGVSSQVLLGTIPLGIILGLVIGKPLGVLGASWLAVRLRWAELPQGAGWLAVVGVACLTGIGFTMSLFIGTLAFEHDTAFSYDAGVRMGVLGGSLISAAIGIVVLQFGLKRASTPASVDTN